MAEPIEADPSEFEGAIEADPSEFEGAPAPEKPSTLTDKANQFLYGINERLGAIPRAVEDIVAGNVSIAGKKIPLPWGGGETKRPVSNAMKEAFYPVDAVTAGEKIARSAGSYVPDTLAMMAMSGAPAIGGTAQALIAGTRPTAKTFNDVAADTARHAIAGSRQGLVAAPVATTLGEVAAGAGAGAGGEMYRQNAADPSIGGEMASEFGGAALTALPTWAARSASRLVGGWFDYTPTGKLMQKGAETAADHLPPDMLERFPRLKAASERRSTAKRDQTMRDLQSEFGAIGEKEAQEALAEAERLRGVIGPEFKPTLGEATGMQSALTTQRAIENRASGADLDTLATGYRARRKAVGDFLDGSAPVAPGTEAERVRAPATAASRMVARERTAVEQELARVGDEEAVTLAAYLPEADRYKAGEALMDRLLTQKQETSARMTAMFDELVPEENKFVPFAKLQQRIAGLKPSLFADTSDLGPTVKKIVDWQASPEARPTFNDVRYLRESLGNEQRMARRAGDRQLARRLGDAIDEVDDFLETDWAKGLNKGVADKYRQFRQTYKADYIDRFEKGSTREAKRVGADNDFRTPNEDVAFEFWSPGGVTEARQFKATFGDDPLAKKALYAVALDDLRKKAAPGGQWNEAAYRRWLGANEANLREFPELQDHVGKMQNAVDALSARRAELVGRQAAIAEHVVTRTLKRDPEQITKVVFSNPNDARRLATEMTAEEREMTGRLAWDWVARNGASADDMRKILAERRGALSVWLKPDQLKRLDDAAKAWAMLERSSPPQGSPVTPDAMGRLKKTLGTGLPQIASRVFAVQSGRTSMRYTMVDLMVRAGIAMNGREAETLARQAIYDPAFAKDLAKYLGALTGKSQKPEMPRPLKAYVGAVLAQPRGSEQEEPGPPGAIEPTDEERPDAGAGE